MEQCPMCGYKDTINNRPQTNAMNNYVFDTTGTPYGVLNSDDAYLTIDGVKYRRADLGKGYKEDKIERQAQVPQQGIVPKVALEPAFSNEKFPLQEVSGDSVYTPPVSVVTNTTTIPSPIPVTEEPNTPKTVPPNTLPDPLVNPTTNQSNVKPAVPIAKQVAPENVAAVKTADSVSTKPVQP